MTDVRLKEYSSLEGVTLDWLLLDSGSLDEREELATLARVALGTDALAAVDEVLPDPDSTDRRGWWGDLDAEDIWGGWPIGTKNWLLTRAKITGSPSSEGSTLERARQYTYDALQPLIEKRIASAVEVVATRTELQRIEVRAQIFRGPLLEIDLRYQLLWDELKDLPIVEVPSIRVDHPIRPESGDLTLTNTAPTVTQPFFDISMQPAKADLSLTPTAPLIVKFADLVAGPLANGSPSIGASALGQKHVLVGAAATTRAPGLGQPAVGAALFPFTMSNFFGLSVLGPIAIVNNNPTLTAVGIASGAAVLGRPILAGGGNVALTAAAIATGATVIAHPILSGGNNAALSAAAFASSAASIGQAVPTINRVLSAPTLAGGAPTLSTLPAFNSA